MLPAGPALALPTILPETEKSFTSKSTSTDEVEKSNGEKVTCKEDRDESGTIEQPRPLGLFHDSLSGCTALGLVNCTGLGDAAGVVLVLGSWHLVYDSLATGLNNDGVAFLYLYGAVHFECASKLFVIKLGGMVLCLILNPTALTKVFEFHCKRREGASGKPAETKYWDGNGTLQNIVGLQISENESGQEEVADSSLGTWEFANAVLIMT
jgi:hypothetical protein